MGAIEFLASLGKYPRLPRPTAAMQPVEKALLLTITSAETGALLAGKLPTPAWVVEQRLHGDVVAAQRSLYQQINDRAEQILEGLSRGEDPRLTVAAAEYYDALWSAYLGASHGIVPLSQALGRNEPGLDVEFETRLGVLQAVSDQLKSDMPLLQKGAFEPLSQGIDHMWKSVCAAPGNKSHPECIKRGLGIEPTTIAIGIAISVAIIIAIAYCLLKMYEVKQFNERWIARCSREDLDPGTLKWCNSTGGPPPSFDPNALARTVAWIAAAGLGAYALITFLPQIVGSVSRARKAGAT
jgi:hypothetical protein